MNVGITIKPSNFAQKIGSVDFKKTLTKAVAIIAKRLEAEGKKQATRMIYQQPVSKSGYMRTGYLRLSIMGDSLGLEGSVVAWAEYSGYVHDGTRHMRGRPFFTKAVQSLQKQLEKETGNMIEISIERQVK